MSPYPFDPDWTLAPAALLREWLEERGHTRGSLARAAGRGETDIKAGLLTDDVLAKRPLGTAHAEMLERGTGIPARLWLSYEANYRRDLAAGRKDVTDD
jgi:HTH-type transcriptional regulator / antitoxin HigA